MAPLQGNRKTDNNDRQLQALSATAHETLDVLHRRDEVPPKLSETIKAVIKRPLSTSPGTPSSAKASLLDAIGTKIWNAATKLSHHERASEQAPPMNSVSNEPTTLLRVFAFHLIDTAYHASPKRSRDINQRIRNFKLALRTCRFCLENAELERASKILEKCSEHVDVVNKASPLVHLTNEHDGPENGTAALKLLVSEFYLLQTMHAWKTGRLDLAAYFNSTISAEHLRSTHLAEKAADLYYEIGKSLLRDKQPEPAAEWLGKALEALDASELEDRSDDTADLRLTVTSKLVDCLLSTGRSEESSRARSLVEYLSRDQTLCNRLAVQIMRLNMLLVGPEVMQDHVWEVLQGILRSFVLTDQTFNMVMQAIHSTRRHSVMIACDALCDLVRARLLQNLTVDDSSNQPDKERLEKACVTLALFATSAVEPTKSSTAERIQQLLQDLYSVAGECLSTRAIHAMQTLIWKTAGEVEPASEKWLEVLRHPIFDSAGQANKARIGRKAMTLAMERNDLNSAQEIFFKMSVNVQNEQLTQYLMFKIALRSTDYKAACASLDAIVKHTHDDGKYLYACVLEAQESNMRHIAVAAFKALLDKQPPGIHLPTLLRCTARLLVAELGSAPDSGTSDMVDQVVGVFEQVKASIRVLKQSIPDRWRAELQWWSKNAYNVALRLCGTAHPELLFRLLVACTTLIDSCPKDGGVMHEDDLERRKMLCHFLAASTLIVLARGSEEDEGYRLQCYVKCRIQIEAFKTTYNKSRTDEDLERRMFEILKYEVECILRLQQWRHLNAVLQACLDLSNVDRWDTLADLVLIIHAQSSTIEFEGGENPQIISTIQRIINETWKKDKDLVKVSRWLRLTFSVDLSDGDSTFALKLLQQAADMAKKGQASDSADNYPETELQWLATTAFNKAIDFLSSGEWENAMSWMDGALEVARYAADEGALHHSLTQKKAIAMERIESSRRGRM